MTIFAAHALKVQKPSQTAFAVSHKQHAQVAGVMPHGAEVLTAAKVNPKKTTGSVAWLPPKMVIFVESVSRVQLPNAIAVVALRLTPATLVEAKQRGAVRNPKMKKGFVAWHRQIRTTSAVNASKVRRLGHTPPVAKAAQHAATVDSILHGVRRSRRRPCLNMTAKWASRIGQIRGPLRKKNTVAKRRVKAVQLKKSRW